MKRIVSLFLSLSLIVSSVACTFSDWFGLTSTQIPPTPIGPTPTPMPAASVTFNVTLPAPILPDETLYLSIVDEVTGLGLNPKNYPMQALDATHYTLTLPFPLGSVVTYRYLRQAVLPIFEDDAYDQPVRYRMYYVQAPGIVQDVVTSWSDMRFTGATGRVSGKVVSAVDGKPIPGILIAVGGQQTLTDSTGYFLIDGLLPGIHNLVAFAPDGAYQTFQQGAMVAEGKNTPAEFSLQPSQFVSVTFLVHAPPDTVQNAPIRLAGNLITLGNTFANLHAGFSTMASRMPTLTPVGGGRYSLTLSLPAGIDIRYKYTLGDGYWNAEHAPDGSFVLRQLILPAGQSTFAVQEYISTWQDGPSSPILFEVETPPETPVSDMISIQFNPYGWAEPIPMWPLGNGKWMYRLYSPFRSLSTFQYRYCRNDQCGIADDIETAPPHYGRTVTPSLTPQNLKTIISAWKWLQPNQPNAVVGLPVTPRASDFWAGVEFLPASDPSWQPWMPQA
ncbi:MAG: carboxypeptidase regulatory-like domain-containing protein, partial [Anaerolineales bacterium]|nr:carboxypeptidase regulatory-like domain-containing protein [Anaerolineales bacterium]